MQGVNFRDMSFRDRAIALLVVGPIILILARKRIHDGVAGPQDVEASQLVAMQDVPAHRFVRVVRDGHALRFKDLTVAAFHEEEVHQVTGQRHASASFAYLDEGTHHLLVRNADLAETGDSDIVGLVTTLTDTELHLETPGEAIYLDCNQTGYRIGSLAFLAAGLLAIGLGLDQARRARRSAS